MVDRLFIKPQGALNLNYFNLKGNKGSKRIAYFEKMSIWSKIKY